MTRGARVVEAMTSSAWSRIVVVGAGAIGSYFGAVLAKAGASVNLIGRERHVQAINRDGLIFLTESRTERIALRATTDIAAVGAADLVLFCVKSLDTGQAARQMAPHLGRDAVVLSLQNGVDNVERIRLHVRNRVFPVLVYVGANIPAPGRVTHTAGNRIVIGELGKFRAADSRDALERVVALFNAAGISTQISSDIESDLWTKLVMNAAYNVISALSGAQYGQMVAVPEVRAIMRAVVDEVAQVARAKGIRLPDDIADAAMAFAHTMPTTRSSMAQDFANGRPTEVDHLNGYIVREAEALGIVTPVNRTLTALMKLLERLKLDRA